MEGMKNLFKKINPKKWSEKTKYLVASTIFLVIAALVLTWFLEYRYFINDFFRSWSFVFGSPQVFFFNAFVVWLILMAI
jgi:hypothetical protein